jgi:hypothetical protein
MDIAASSATPPRSPVAIEIRPAPTGDASASASDAKAAPERSFWQRAFGDDGFSFGTLLDIVNPLQHIPVVSTIYQKLTGDVASPAANLIGGALFGGTIGLAVAAADTALKGETGKDMGGHVLALFESDPSPTTTAVAAADAAPDANPSAPPDDSTAQDSKVAENTPAPVSPPAQTPHPDAAKPAPVAPVAATGAQPSPFFLAGQKRHATGHGFGGSYVPFETRSTIVPASMLAPAYGGFAAPVETSAPKAAAKDQPLAKSAGATVPDLKALAADPAAMRKLQTSGLRPPVTRPVPLNVSSGIAVPPNAAIPALPLDAAARRDGPPPSANAGDGDSDGYAALMARNLARYMALQNKRPAPSKVDRNF